jgi:hypothetical protein
MVHGIEIFNSNQELVYSSRYKTIRLIKKGSLTIQTFGDEVTITFPETVEKPEFWANKPNYVNGEEYKPNYTRLYFLFAEILKNADNNYNAVKFSCLGTASIPAPPSNIDGLISFPWEINYLIFK